MIEESESSGDEDVEEKLENILLNGKEKPASIQVKDILNSHPELELIDLTEYLPAELQGAIRDGALSLWTHRHETDAMYMAVFRKKDPLSL